LPGASAAHWCTELPKMLRLSFSTAIHNQETLEKLVVVIILYYPSDKIEESKRKAMRKYFL
jgi:hypothetical protein